jgi:hypothetical protein
MWQRKSRVNTTTSHGDGILVCVTMHRPQPGRQPNAQDPRIHALGTCIAQQSPWNYQKPEDSLKAEGIVYTSISQELIIGESVYISRPHSPGPQRSGRTMGP